LYKNRVLIQSPHCPVAFKFDFTDDFSDCELYTNCGAVPLNAAYRHFQFNGVAFNYISPVQDSVTQVRPTSPDYGSKHPYSVGIHRLASAWCFPKLAGDVYLMMPEIFLHKIQRRQETDEARRIFLLGQSLQA
jgi:hypothetical protein